MCMTSGLSWPGVFQEITLKKIVYVGHKEQKGDNIGGTGLVWTRGQVHEVEDDAKADKLLKHDLIWRDATDKSVTEIAQMLLPEFKQVEPTPAAHFVVEGAQAWDPFSVEVPADILAQLRRKELIPVFMTEADADAYSVWKKLEEDTSPKNSGPKPQDKETKAGLDSKAGFDATKQITPKAKAA